jgi:multiple sugar transport system substrate-binding protein
VQRPALQKIVEKYNSSQDDVRVTIELSPWSSYWTKLDAAAGAGQAPDVFWMNVYLPKYADAGVLLPLDDYIGRDDIDMSKYVETVVDMYNYSGTQWAMPKGLDSVAVALNTELFDKYDVELPKPGWTWEDMRKMAAELRDGMEEADSDAYPVLMELDAQPSHFNFVHQTGGFIISEDYTKSGYNQSETTLAYQKVVDLLNEDLLAPYRVLSDTKGTDLFLSKMGAILFVGSWKAAVLEDSSIAEAGNCQMITMPKQEESNESVLGGLGYAISNSTEYPDEAWDFVKFITGPVGNEIQAKAGIDIPALISAQKYYKENFDNINVETFFKAAENSFPFPADPDLTRWLGIVNDYAARIFAQEISPEEGTQAIYEQMQSILDE